jgi:hypothetical protein
MCQRTLALVRAIMKNSLRVLGSFLIIAIGVSINVSAQTVVAGFYQITPLNSAAQCLDIAGPSKADGSALQIYDCGTATGSTNQVFKFVPIVVSNSSYFQMVNVYSGLCVDVDGVSTAHGAHLQQYDCGGAGSRNQLWSFQPSNASYQIVSLNSGMCLDLPGGNTTHGTQLQQYDCGGGQNPNQLWSLHNTASTSAAPAPAPIPAAGAVPSSFFGMTVLNYQNSYPNVTYGTVRTWDTYPSVNWSALNPARGVYNWGNLDSFMSQTRGKDIVYTFGVTPNWASTNPNATSPNGTLNCAPPANYADLDNFVQALAQHVNGAIKYWEMWDEPQYYFCGSTSDMMNVIQHIHKGIKAVDPSSKLLLPAGTTQGGPQYVGSLLAAGASQYADMITLHGYGYGADEAVATTIQSYQSIMQQYGVNLPLWDLEADWVYSSSQSSSSLLPAYLAKSYLLHWSFGVPRLIWYAWDGGYWGGLDANSGNTSAAMAYAQVYKWMVGANLSSPCTANQNGTWSCAFTRSDYKAIALWNSNGPSIYIVPAGFVQFRDLYGNVSQAAAGTSISIGNSPILLETGSVF